MRRKLRSRSAATTILLRGGKTSTVLVLSRRISTNKGKRKEKKETEIAFAGILYSGDEIECLQLGPPPTLPLTLPPLSCPLNCSFSTIIYLSISCFSFFLFTLIASLVSCDLVPVHYLFVRPPPTIHTSSPSPIPPPSPHPPDLFSFGIKHSRFKFIR